MIRVLVVILSSFDAPLCTVVVSFVLHRTSVLILVLVVCLVLDRTGGAMRSLLQYDRSFVLMLCVLSYRAFVCFLLGGSCLVFGSALRKYRRISSFTAVTVAILLRITRRLCYW
jgi:hypothetical protein